MVGHMGRETKEREHLFPAKDENDSPSVDEGSSGGAPGVLVLKKGPWTGTEDAILTEYVKKHGEGNWNAVQKNLGLFRCGKSCRLRWANHLRPNLKKGAFTPEEERLIIELHSRMGNKWARMAAQLPGRTDNEIKNYWNTRLKRLQRAGLPLYPPDMNLQTANNKQKDQTFSKFGLSARHHSLLHASGIEIPPVSFDGIKASQEALPLTPSFIPMADIPAQGFGSFQGHAFQTPLTYRAKRFRDYDTTLPCFQVGESGPLLYDPPFNPFQDTFEKVQRPFSLCFPSDADFNARSTNPLGTMNLGIHASSFPDNLSASKPLDEVKLELPSFQNPFGNVGTNASLPPLHLETVESFTHPPPVTHSQIDIYSPQSSGLLQLIIHESQALSSSKNSCESSAHSSVVPGETGDNSIVNQCGTEWFSFIGSSPTSIFNECNPPPPDGSLVASSTVGDMAGINVKSEAADLISDPRVNNELEDGVPFTRPDAFLESDWFQQSLECIKDQSTVTDAISTLLADNVCNNYKQLDVESSTRSQSSRISSLPWDKKSEKP